MKITINLNKKLDYEVYTDFWDFSIAGVDFGNKIKQNHPNINLNNYIQYIDNFYNTNEAIMLEKKGQINHLLEEKIKDFSSALKNIFYQDFNNTVYQGYLSIFNCNPRYLDTKTFQIFYEKDLPHMLEVAFHESLHFVFFDYLDKFFTKQIEGLDKNSGILWELSEIINVLILNLPQFKKIIGKEEKLFYPELRIKLDNAINIWDSSANIDEFITKYLQNCQSPNNQQKLYN